MNIYTTIYTSIYTSSRQPTDTVPTMKNTLIALLFTTCSLAPLPAAIAQDLGHLQATTEAELEECLSHVDVESGTGTIEEVIDEDGGWLWYIYDDSDNLKCWFRWADFAR